MRRHAPPVAAILIAALATTAIAQSPIQWEASANRGVAEARRTQQPLLFYVVGDDDVEESDLKDAQDRSFRDPTVRGFVQQRFVPVKLSQTSTTAELLRNLKVRADFGLFLLVVTPDSDLVGKIAPVDAASPPRLLKRLSTLFREYRAALYKAELRPVLKADELQPQQMGTALRLVREFLIAEADQSVADLLERDKLTERLRRDVYDTLATLSTKRSVAALLKAAERSTAARGALRECTPAGALHMLPALTSSSGDVRPYVYDAVTAICEVDDLESELFWDVAEPGPRQKEIERVEREVRETASRWREKYAMLR